MHREVDSEVTEVIRGVEGGETIPSNIYDIVQSVDVGSSSLNNEKLLLCKLFQEKERGKRGKFLQCNLNRCTDPQASSRINVLH